MKMFNRKAKDKNNTTLEDTFYSMNSLIADFFDEVDEFYKKHKNNSEVDKNESKVTS